MRNHWKIFSFLLGLSIAFLNLTNPTEIQYLSRISHDYGKSHHGMPLDPKMLLDFGESTRSSYFIFSTYKYQFGSVSVSYLGFANGTYFITSSVEVGKRDQNQKTQLRQT